MDLHVAHVAVETLGQPGKQAGFGAREVDTGDADLGESELACPGTHLGHQRRSIELTAVEHHAPIVGSASSPLTWAGEDDTRAFAERLAAQSALADAFIALHGNLGAGKTTLVRHLLRALGAQGRIKSPTYAVVEPYDLPGQPAWHFDFYRFDDPQEWEDAGFRDVYAGRGLKVAEWPDKAAGLLPEPDLRIDIAVADAADAVQGDEDADAPSPLPRRVRFDALTPRGAGLLP
jgi:tRNA threonylcarbamoyladenosine biosynthesis protein TsaE